MWEMFLGYPMDEWIKLSKAMEKFGFTPTFLAEILEESFNLGFPEEISFDEWNW